MRLGASPDGAALSDAAAGVGAAMDAYLQVGCVFRILHSAA
jgi:hypothetical protein